MSAFEGLGPRSASHGVNGRPSSRDDVLSLAERSRHLNVLRVALALLIAGSIAVWPTVLTGAVEPLVIATLLYVSLSVVVAVVASRWPARRVTLPVLQGALLVDGLYLVTAGVFAGGVQGPAGALIAAHLVAATLLGSYRTGLKVALWDTLLIVLAERAIAAGVLPVAATPPEAGPSTAIVIAIGGLWAIALTTAACAAASERTLRTQRADLASLTMMAARIEERPNADDIPVVLLDELCAMFRFRRGTVLIGRFAELEVAAASDGVVSDAANGVELDPLVAAVRDGVAPSLVRTIDPRRGRVLAAMLPDARNVVLLPLRATGGPCLGVVVLERGGRGAGIPRWTLAMIERFVGHAALALANAWLTEERDAQLTMIEALEQDLRAHNADLEDRVAARTAQLRETIETLRETDTQRRRLLEHVVRVAEEERRKIANDVHDDPVQKLVALKMRLELLATRHREEDLAKAKEAVQGVIHSMRHLLFDLRPPELDEAAFDDALRYLLEQSELPFVWSVEGHLDPEPSEQGRVILYRIAQEAVANARKHSQAERLTVRLARRDGGMWMEISDDGVGFLPQEAVVAAPGHLGLAAMRERAEMAGGSCELRSLPGGGTTLTVCVPYDAPAGVPSFDEDLGSPDETWRQIRAS